MYSKLIFKLGNITGRTITRNLPQAHPRPHGNFRPLLRSKKGRKKPSANRIREYFHVASPSDSIFPASVLLSEVRMKHPALRVTANNFLFKFNRFFYKFAIKIAKKIEKIDFSKFSILSLF